MPALLQTFARLGPIRLAALGAVALGLLGFFVFLTNRLSVEDMTVLYADLDASDSGKIVTKLESLNVPFELSPDGSRIRVPASRAARIRMEMAQEGLPTGGSIGYEIFDKGSVLGTTSFAQQLNHLRAMEGELSRSIRTLAPVQGARVHLVLPKREAFSRDTEEPSASIILQMRGGNTLNRAQVQAIQNLVAAAVPRLTPGRISVIDDRGNLLARGNAGQDASGVLAATAEEMRANNERRLARTIEELLERSVGLGKVRAEVSVEMDFDRVTTNSETFDPDRQVVRSTQTVTEANQSRDGEKTVTVSNNLPDAGATDGDKPQRTNSSNRSEETINYEVSKTVKMHVREGGVIRRVSAAVLVDGRYSPDASGNAVYEPRNADELAKLGTLVKSAIGFDEARGDKVEVVNLQFVQPSDLGTGADGELGPLGLAKADWFRIAEIGTLSIVGLLVMLLVVRPLLMRLMDTQKPAEALAGMLPNGMTGGMSDAGAGQPALAAGQAMAALTGPAGDPAAAADGTAGPEDRADLMVDIAQVTGRVKASAVKGVGQIIDQHPEIAIGMLRHWMHQEG